MATSVGHNTVVKLEVGCFSETSVLVILHGVTSRKTIALICVMHAGIQPIKCETHVSHS
jgi:hypothetical protein